MQASRGQVRNGWILTVAIKQKLILKHLLFPFYCHHIMSNIIRADTVRIGMENVLELIYSNHRISISNFFPYF